MSENIQDLERQFGCNRYTIISLTIFWILIIFQIVIKLVPFLKLSYQKFKKYSSLIYIFFKIYKLCVYITEYDMFCISNLFYFAIKIINSFLNFFIVKNLKTSYKCSELCDNGDTRNNFLNEVNYEERTIQETNVQSNAPFKKTNISSGEFLYRRHTNNQYYNSNGYLV
jgi:hypothetical protein